MAPCSILQPERDSKNDANPEDAQGEQKKHEKRVVPLSNAVVHEWAVMVESHHAVVAVFEFYFKYYLERLYNL